MNSNLGATLKVVPAKSDNLSNDQWRQAFDTYILIMGSSPAHMGSESIALYLKALQEGCSPVYRLSVLLTGAYGVGKSCIARRMLDKCIGDVNSTNGIDVNIMGYTGF
jgi:hypothetical protein